MNKQYPWLVGVLILALLGILVLQAIYTLDNYRIKSSELEEELNQLFAEAVQEEKQSRKDSTLRWFRDYLSDTSKIVLSVHYDAEENQLRNSIQDRQDSSPYTSVSFSDDDRKINELDSANREITIDYIVESTSNYLDQNSIYYWTEHLGERMSQLTDSLTLDTAQLHHIFRKHLQSHRISSSYQLRSIPIDSTLGRPVGKKLYTEALSTGITGGDTKTFAQFDNPFVTVLHRARWSILGSVMIILLTAGSFFTMLRTILRQKKLAQIKDDFIDNISHELQTPIATLRAANESMRKYQLLNNPQKAQQYLDISQQQIQRLSEMVDQTLRNSIYARKGIQIHTEAVDLDQMIKELLEAYRLKKPAVAYYFEPQLSNQKVLVDPVHLKSCLENLLENAIKHNAEKEALTIKINTNIIPGESLIIRVADNGKGIAPTDQLRVFDKFYRVDDRQANGYGIGLFYVKTALRAMGGSVSLHSQAGRGAEFTLKIPLQNG